MFSPASDPLDLEILLIPGATLILTASAIEPLRAANRILGRRHFFWRISTPGGAPAITAGGIPVPADHAFGEGPETAPLFVIASYDHEASATPGLLRRLGRSGRARPMAGGADSGVALMARAGLLDGHAATTHWEDLDDLAARHPAIEARRDRFVIDRTRFTAAGAGPMLDLMLELIARRLGRPLAQETARLLMHEPAAPRAPEEPRAPKAPADPRVEAALRLMETHLEDPLSIEDVARAAGVSARRLQALFQEALGVGPKGYYQGLRLNLARRRIIESRDPVADVAAAAGFEHSASFNRAYAAAYGETPSQTRRRVRG